VEACLGMMKSVTANAITTAMITAINRTGRDAMSKPIAGSP